MSDGRFLHTKALPCSMDDVWVRNCYIFNGLILPVLDSHDGLEVGGIFPPEDRASGLCYECVWISLLHVTRIPFWLITAA